VQENNAILDLIGYDPITMETLVAHSGLTSEHLSAMLLTLELESKVSSLSEGRFQRVV
jgi:DNA processing protein